LSKAELVESFRPLRVRSNRLAEFFDRFFVTVLVQKSQASEEVRIGIPALQDGVTQSRLCRRNEEHEQDEEWKHLEDHAFTTCGSKSLLKNGICEGIENRSVPALSARRGTAVPRARFRLWIPSP
jgi:hypothetical protein